MTEGHLRKYFKSRGLVACEFRMSMGNIKSGAFSTWKNDALFVFKMSFIILVKARQI